MPISTSLGDESHNANIDLKSNKLNLFFMVDTSLLSLKVNLPVTEQDLGLQVAKGFLKLITFLVVPYIPFSLEFTTFFHNLQIQSQVQLFLND